MEKTYISEIHSSFNVQGNPYVILNINEFDMVKDKHRLSKYFTNSELIQIFSNSISTRIFLQDSEKIVYNAENYCTINKTSLFNDKNIVTYIINFNKQVTYPAKLNFEYSYNLNLYSHLKEKLKNKNFVDSLAQKEDVQILFNQIVDYEETLLNFNNSIREKIILETSDIDPRKFMEVKERAHYPIGINVPNNFLQGYTLESDGYTTFPQMIINNNSNSIPYQDNDLLIDFYTKLINVNNDYDYKRFLFSRGIFDIIEKNKETSTSPSDARTNTTSVSTFVEDSIFKLNDTSLKTSKSKESANLFLLFILSTDEIKEPVGDAETNSYNSFLSNSFLYPSYFFNHILKFKLEYLSSVEEKSMYETWEEINGNNLQSLSGKKIMCRVNLKNKKYYDKLAYEYFIVGA